MSKLDFELLDSGDFYKLEKVGPYYYYRPSPAAVWSLTNKNIKYDAKYERYQEGKGEWFFETKKIPETFNIDVLNLKIEIQHTSFGHLGIFPEQVKNWKRLYDFVQPGEKVLNLFAYTGIASLICASKKAEVAHVDASKTSVEWAKKNQSLSGLENEKVRWLVDDVQKFVQKEIRRESKYDWIILDPPSFGRGKKNEVWQIEEHLNELMKALSQLKSKSFKGILLSSHSPNYSPVSLLNTLKTNGFNEKNQFCEEMLIDNKRCPLPSGACAWSTSTDLN